MSLLCPSQVHGPLAVLDTAASWKYPWRTPDLWVNAALAVKLRVGPYTRQMFLPSDSILSCESNVRAVLQACGGDASAAARVAAYLEESARASAAEIARGDRKAAAKRRRTDFEEGSVAPPVTAGQVVRAMVRADDVASGAGVTRAAAEDALRQLSVAALAECPCEVAPALQTAARFVSSGCAGIDRHLGGGFACGHLTEIAGPAGVGKTQILLQASLQAVAAARAAGSKPCEAKSLFLATEGFPSERALQIADHVAREAGVAGGGVALMENIMVSSRSPKQGNWEHLVQCVSNIARMAELGHVDIACVVLDSIAAACGDYSGDAAVRAPMLAGVAGELKRLSCLYNFPLIVSNHVVANVSAGGADALRHVAAFEDDVRPALGHAWSALPNTRLLLTRTPTVRTMCVTTSPFLASSLRNSPSLLRYEVTAAGVAAAGGGA